eukprot:394618-Pyramimonas_sp.AAC.1
MAMAQSAAANHSRERARAASGSSSVAPSRATFAHGLVSLATQSFTCSCASVASASHATSVDWPGCR